MKRFLILPVLFSFNTWAINSDPHSDIFNVYKYLKDKEGNCITQEPLSKARCIAKARNTVTQFKTGYGYIGHVFGLKGTQNDHVNKVHSSGLDLDLDGLKDPITKYSGPVSTYTAKHYPIAVKHNHFTYFVYSGPVILDNGNLNNLTDLEVATASVVNPYSMGDINGSINKEAGANQGVSPFGRHKYSNGQYLPDNSGCFFNVGAYLSALDSNDPNVDTKEYDREFRDHRALKFDPDRNYLCNKTNTIGVYVGKYNHTTKKVSRPVLVHAKYTDDPHDNAVINVDNNGHVVVLVAGRGPRRGSFVFRTSVAGDLSTFKDVTPESIDYAAIFDKTAHAAGLDKTATLFEADSEQFRGMAYPKLFSLPDNDGTMRVIYTVYCKGRQGDQLPINANSTCTNTKGGGQSRQLHTATMTYDKTIGKMVIDIKKHQVLAALGGHYAIAKAKGNEIHLAFNAHLDANTDNRVNLYHMFSTDGGKSWKYLDKYGYERDIVTPIVSKTEIDKLAVIQDRDLSDFTSTVTARTFVKDIDFKRENNTLQVYALTVRSCVNNSSIACTNGQGYLPTTESIHSLYRSYWNGRRWANLKLTDSVDHNYSTGMVSNVKDQGIFQVFYPKTQESYNNALAGGGVAMYREVITPERHSIGHFDLAPVTRKPKTKQYYKNLCEFNYIRSVLNGSDDIVGIMSASNPQRFEPSKVNSSMPASPLFLLSSTGRIFRLPMFIDPNDEEASLREEDGDLGISCNVQL
ncbi:hypothetical protein [Pseudoalteromonas byunsanensis]|uniref:Uncharacterized protein n=1 Tax=Pseudoalteromonas byunsanensis TaxID=327939 RepID=A0A1S1N974_9GAMM|nr:hypothetical protein [Pseudoalteromonas byunsanensis]OHU95982.1 hypothetical protein BIW53_09270 [Pseudoalteromonas byunsanensis]